VVVFSAYVLLLLAVTGYYDIKEQYSRDFDFIFRAFFGCLITAFVSSTLFFIIVYLVDKTLTLLFVFLVPFLNIATAFCISSLLDLVLWSAGLEGSVSIFQKLFLVSTIATLVTTLWLAGTALQKKMIIKNG
jgi:hypothetical protein